MQTVSLELGRRLRELGLEWKPELGDRCFCPDRGDDVWLPRLDQVIDGIAKGLHPPVSAHWREVLVYILYLTGSREHWGWAKRSFTEAAGLALVHIMEAHNA